MHSLYTALALAGAASAHMAMWHPSNYGFNNGYEPATPLANKNFNDWWFHGYANDRPSEVMSITPGQSLKIEIACSKSYSSWGNSPSPDACPGDAGSYHAGGSTGSGSGWNGNSESNLMGCALSIAAKPNAASTRPEDFIVMSVQENCVRQRDTYFDIPDNLPACPEGGCTCSFWWQGRNSAAEMYMNGFRCNVVNGRATAWPTPAKPVRGNTISGPTQPMYWANDNSNLNYNPGWNDRPSYNRAFGWQNGAQTSAFSSAGGNSDTGNNGNNSTPSSSVGENSNNNGNWWESSTSTTATSTTSTRRGRPTNGSNDNNGNGGNTWNGGNNNNAASSSSSSTTSSAAGQPTAWNQHLAQPDSESASSSSSSSSSTSTAAAAPTADKPKSPTCIRRAHKKRSSRSRAH